MMRHFKIGLVFGLFIILFASCSEGAGKKSDQLFQILDSGQTGIKFTNQLHDSDSLNILSYLYYYNGGGVAVGDINNDGLPDIYFTGNQSGNKLYLNKGHMHFTDITKSAGVACSGAWNTGVSMVDVSGDGLLDIYVCQVDKITGKKGRNQLFINNGDLTFTELAHLYGLDFKGLATHATFFDYDRDGDLDCFLLNHSLKDPQQFKPAELTHQLYDPASGCRLLENQHGQFVDVTQKTGIFNSPVGFGLGVDIGDLNRDGWPDIYVGNDFHENDYMYINNHDGTFREVVAKATGHTSNFTMGVSIADINNDGLPDILSLDMKPEDETTYKMSGGWESFSIYEFKRSFGYHHQSSRNALQINQGMNEGVPVFSELACLYGIEATDWSWSPLIADFNGDGHKDIFISNGIARRPNDLDFVNYYSNDNINNKNTGLKLINMMPRGGADNYLYLNVPDSNSFRRIPIEDPGTKITNGATYSDLDRDGDLDIVCNNLNQASYILQNNSPQVHYIAIQLKDTNANPFGLGSQLTLYQKNNLQYQTIDHISGFESGKEQLAYFFTGGQPVDSLIIQWPDGTCQVIKQLIPGFQVIQKAFSSYSSYCTIDEKPIPWHSLSVHHENAPNDLDVERWMPYSLSSFGPRMAIGKKYYYVTDASQHGTLHRLNDDADVTNLIIGMPDLKKDQDENDAAFADFNKDGFEDLFITLGGNIMPSGNESEQELLFFGNANGTFQYVQDKLPKSERNCSVVRPCDYDHDGDVDLFVGTLSRPGHYGWSEPSYFYINDGKGSFSVQEAPIWEMVFDAQWADMDGDGLQDLVVAGHWMPITILYNRKTHWEKETLPNSEGLWFSILLTDINGDSIPDIIAGNFGLNHPIDADVAHPLILYLNDFDLNGQSDPILTYMHGDKRYVYPNLELFLQILPSRKKDYVFNKNFAGKDVSDIFPKNQLDKATQRICNEMSSGVFISDQKSKTWKFNPLPSLLQRGPIWSICRIDHERFVFGGNLYNVDPNWGRQDALFPTVMNYTRERGWTSDDSFNLGFHRRSEVRDMKMIRGQLYIASNNDTLISISTAIK